MFLLTWRLVAIAATLSFLVGIAAGGGIIYKVWRISDLEARNQNLVVRLNAIASALNLGQKLDDESSEADINNQEILDAIQSRAADLRRGDDPVCIDADGMRNILRLK